MDTVNELQNNSKKFNKIIIWGFKSKWHTHRFIFQAYYRVLKKSKIPVIWVDDSPVNISKIESGDLIISASGMYGKMVPKKSSLSDYNMPIRDDVYYCVHEENDFFLEKLNMDRVVNLKYYSNGAEDYTKIDECVFFDEEKRTLYQPWGTNLMPNEFKKPTYSKSKFVFWVGSIWKGEKGRGGGNITEIEKLKNSINSFGLKFIPTRFIPNFLNIFLIRISRLAPAIGGIDQVEKNYLPCRMFKNISYGQLGFSNIKKFQDIFKDCLIYDEDFTVMINKILLLEKDEYKNIIEKQQEICKKYTIMNNLINIFSKF